MSVVGIIGDPHEPWCDRRYMDFCSDTFDWFNVDRIVCIGDWVDLYSFSTYGKDPSFPMTPRQEIAKARKRLAVWAERFPVMDITAGNHDNRVLRSALSVGITPEFMKSYGEVWQTPSTWNWLHEFRIDGVDYFHGDGWSGVTAARRCAIERGRSVVLGHLHTCAKIDYIQQTTRRKPIFGMSTGSGCDRKAMVYRYERDPRRWPLAAGVVFNGEFGLVRSL